MTEKIEISDKAIQAFNAAAERLMGYVYAGVLPVVILAIEEPEMVKSFVGATGGVFAVIIAIVLGIGVFTVYARIFGELFIYPLQHLFHWFADRAVGRRGRDLTSVVGILIYCGVPLWAARSAYWRVRKEFLSQAEQSRLEVDHGELHVLYLTSLICGLAFPLIAIFGDGAPSRGYIWLAMVALIAALIADTRQHINECVALKMRWSGLEEFLRDTRLAQTRS